MPEVVDHGLTGFIVDDEKEELQAIKRLPELDPSRVRASSSGGLPRHMAEDYVRHYDLLLENRSGRATVCKHMDASAIGHRA